MGIKLGIVMDDLQHIHVDKDSTIAIMLAAAQRGYTLYYMRPQDLFTRDGVVYGRMAEVKEHTLGPVKVRELTSLDCVLMRKDPPFDMPYIYCTYQLEAAERAGLLVLNKPQSLRDCNEKYFATEFPELCPPTLVASNKDEIKVFIASHEACILKPLDGMGGKNIFRVTPDTPNLNVVIDLLTSDGLIPCMAQRYIPEIVLGDKRVLMVMGRPVETLLARIPSPDDFRGNLAAGATGKVMPLGDKERAIALALGPRLVEKGLWFVGIDIIGDYLTEINITSPTCIREIERESNEKICEQLLDALEQLC